MRQPSISRSRSTIPTHVPAKSNSLVLVDPWKLCGVPADERDACLAADLRRALDELGDLLEVDPVRGDVVEEEERIGAARQDVVDAVRGEVGAAVVEGAAGARKDQLRADGVVDAARRSRRADPIGERAEAGRAGRLDRRAEALDDGVARRQRDPRAGVGLALPCHTPSLRREVARSAADQGGQPPTRWGQALA